MFPLPTTQVSSNESYVSVLNHCFDDIEKFIIRLQQSIAASRELLAAKRKASPRSSYQARLADPAGYVTKLGPQGSPITASEMALLSSRARGPNEEDYFEILSKFKLAFNLLAKLKGCIHEPNAPELVHFLFTPLAIIIESSRNGKLSLLPIPLSRDQSVAVYETAACYLLVFCSIALDQASPNHTFHQS